MFRLNVLAALFGFLLLNLALVQGQILGSIFEHYWMTVIFGIVLSGLALGAALSSLVLRRFDINKPAQMISRCMVASILGAVLGFLIVYSLPLGSVFAFVIIILLMSFPYLCAGIGLNLELNSKVKNKMFISVGAGGLFALIILLVLSLSYTQLSVFNKIDFEARWSEEGLKQTKPLYSELNSTELANKPEIRWSAAGRTDLLSYADEVKDYSWILTNGIVPVPVIKQQNQQRFTSWWNAHFPLISLPVLLGKPQSYLSIASVTGPELEIAKHLSVPKVKGLAYNKTFSELISTTENTEHTAAIRNFLQADHTIKYDQIFVPILQFTKYKHFSANLEDMYLYTQEAFNTYWEHLSPGGMLVVTAVDMRLFVKALFMAWQVTDSDLRSQTWGLHIGPGAVIKGSYPMAFIIIKGKPPFNFTEQLTTMSKTLPVNLLFGPGVKPQRPFSLLYRTGGIEEARGILTQVLSQRTGSWLDLSHASDERPFFFQILRSVHPYMKWLVTVCVFVLIYALLFSLPALRKNDSPAVKDHPAIPVFLGYFMFHGLVMTLIAVATVWRTMLPIGSPVTSSFLVYIPWLVGAIVAFVFELNILTKNNVRLGAGLPLIVVVLLLLSYSGLTIKGLSMLEWSSGLISAMVVSLGFVSAFAMTLSLRLGIFRLSERLPELVSWAWAVFGLAALAGAVLSFWFASIWGWSGVWTIAVCGYLFIFVTGFWLWRYKPEKTNRIAPEMA